MRIGIVTIIMLGMILISGAARAQETSMKDSLIIEKAEINKGGAAVVKVIFVNSQELAGLTVPLILGGKGVRIDSISFAGSRVEYIKMKPVTIAENKKQVVFGAITMTEDYLSVGRGLLATLYLSADSSFAGKCAIDTTTMGPASAMYTKKDSYSYVPRISSGLVSFKEPTKKAK